MQRDLEKTLEAKKKLLLDSELMNSLPDKGDKIKKSITDLEKQIENLKNGTTPDQQKIREDRVDKSMETIRELLQNTRLDNKAPNPLVKKEQVRKIVPGPPPVPVPPPPMAPGFDKEIIVTSGKLLLETIPKEMDTSKFRLSEIEKWIAEIHKIKTGERPRSVRKPRIVQKYNQVVEFTKHDIERLIERTSLKFASKKQENKKPLDKNIVVMTKEESSLARSATEKEFMRNGRNFHEENKGISDEQEVVEMLEKMSEVEE